MAKKNFTFSLDIEKVNKLKHLADSQLRSLNNYVEWLIHNELQQKEVIKKPAQETSDNWLSLAQIKSYFKIEQKFNEMKEILKENKVPFEEVAGGEREYNVTDFDIEKLFKS